MIKSMTAYGRASKLINDLRWNVEIHSINRKGMDVNIYAPKDLLFFDIEIRKWIGEWVARGQITVKISLKQDGGSFQGTSLDFDSLKDLKNKWQSLAQQLGYSPDAVDLPFLANQMQTVSSQELIKDEQNAKETLRQVFDEALKDFMEMKLIEGKNLAKDIQARLRTIQGELSKISAKAESAPVKYRDKLKEKLKVLLEGMSIEEERVYREVALFAEKIDITEESVRLDSHLKQAYQLLDSKEKSVGRTFDFLTQEMLREVNTIASKSADLEMTNLSIAIKSELEKIREQVQNVE